MGGGGFSSLSQTYAHTHARKQNLIVGSVRLAKSRLIYSTWNWWGLWMHDLSATGEAAQVDPTVKLFDTVGYAHPLHAQHDYISTCNFNSTYQLLTCLLLNQFPVYIRTHAHTHTRTHTHTHPPTHTPTHAHTRTHTHTHTHKYASTHAGTHECTHTQAKREKRIG